MAVEIPLTATVESHALDELESHAYIEMFHRLIRHLVSLQLSFQMLDT